MEQRIISAINNYIELDEWLEECGCCKLMVVCDGSFTFMEGIKRHLEILKKLGVEITYFRDFQPNPLYENVVSGVSLFRDRGCDGIMAIGGGSAIDVAKCIKLFAGSNESGENGCWLKFKGDCNNTPLLAMPTTAGTGSEATRYAVIYYNGVKQSITSESIIPNAALMDSTVLKTLPLYQKKSTMLDALCHGIESFWSINSTSESIEYSKAAIKGVFTNMNGYLENEDDANRGMMLAAHVAGKAINITQTTAGHAMCYKLTSMFGIAHGHAAYLCDRVLFNWMVGNVGKCVDFRGSEYLEGIFYEIAAAFGSRSVYEGEKKFAALVYDLDLEIPVATNEQIEILKRSVNPDRMRNNPVALDENSIVEVYKMVLDNVRK